MMDGDGKHGWRTNAGRARRNELRATTTKMAMMVDAERMASQDHIERTDAAQTASGSACAKDASHRNCIASGNITDFTLTLLEKRARHIGRQKTCQDSFLPRPTASS